MRVESYTLAERPDFTDEQDRLMSAEWPDFVIEGDGGDGWNELFDRFREFQFVLTVDQEIAAIGNTIPIALERELSELPAEGWDWALSKGHTDKAEGKSPDTLVGLSATVVSAYRGQGLAAKLLDQMKRIARAEGLARLLVPVRPTRKSEYPLIPMGAYAQWTRPDGELFDPWLRVHAKAGGEILEVARRAMTIGGTVQQWSRWTGLDFPGSGEYVIPDGLVPLKVDLEAGHAEYVEPNVWVLHRL